MIAPEEAVRLARLRRAMGGETWLPLLDVVLYACVPANTLYGWVRMGRIRRRDGYVDLGEVLAVRDRSSVRVLDAPLTYRVLGYFRHAANGWTALEIADEYGISINSVHSMIQEATHDLGARNRAHAIALLMAQGLISPAEVQPISTRKPRQIPGPGVSMSEGA